MAKKTFQRKFEMKNYEEIKEFLIEKSPSMIKYLDANPNSEYRLFAKYITHSDIITRGKRNENQGYEKNYLYYLTVDEMQAKDEYNNKRTQGYSYGHDEVSNIRIDSIAHQSNIKIPNEVYEFLDISNKSKEKQQKILNSSEKQLVISNQVNVYLVNDTLQYFDIDYTKDILEKLRKNPGWDYEKYKLHLSNGDFTPIHLTEASHGIGTGDDEEFQKLRMSIFLNDKLILLLSKNQDKKEMFILLDKNPRFFTILGIYNKNWESYLNQKYNQEILKYSNSQKETFASEEEKTRKDQAKWRRQLAEEMMNFTTYPGEIFCPLTGITANYYRIGTLFRASHIKSFKDCTVEEAYDINNGILMCANADALFDKHLITITDEGEIKFSYLINDKLKNDLLLSRPFFSYILTDKRKEYLKIHREIFAAKEEDRKINNNNLEEDSSDETILN